MSRNAQRPLRIYGFSGGSTRAKGASAPPTAKNLKNLKPKSKSLNVFLNWLVGKIRTELAKQFNFSTDF